MVIRGGKGGMWEDFSACKGFVVEGKSGKGDCNEQGALHHGILKEEGVGWRAKDRKGRDHDFTGRYPRFVGLKRKKKWGKLSPYQ